MKEKKEKSKEELQKANKGLFLALMIYLGLTLILGIGMMTASIDLEETECELTCEKEGYEIFDYKIIGSECYCGYQDYMKKVCG